MRNADAIAAELVLRGACHMLVACALILAVQVMLSCMQIDSYTLTGICLLSGLFLLHGVLDRFSAMFLGLWLDLLYGRFLGVGVLFFGVVFHLLEVLTHDRQELSVTFVRKVRFFIVLSIGLGLLALC